MAYLGEIKVGDWVINKRSYSNLDTTFFGKPLKVLRIEKNNLGYAGNAFVFVELRPEIEMGFYIIAIEKYNT